MPALAIKKFTGIFPRVPNKNLPDNAAALAIDCEFSRESLTALKSGLEMFTIETNTADGRGLYTLDGLYFYTWGTEVVAHPNPTIGETYHRIYYIENGRLYTAISPESNGNAGEYVDGGVPPAKWYTGVPNPTAAPVLALVDRTELSDYPNAGFTWRVWWELNGTRHSPQDTSASEVTKFKTYTVTVPSMPGTVPAGAVVVVEAALTDGSKTLFTLNTSGANTAPSRTQALPGGVEMSLNDSGGVYTATFSWGVVETRAYIYTMQNTWDEESGPSPAALISPTYIQDVRVTTAQPDFNNYRPWKQTNIYRTYGGNSYIKTETTKVTDLVYDDASHTVSSIGTLLKSLAWVPPETNMFGLIALPNGWFAAFKENVLYMSEPYRPHAWPYSISFPKNITGICAGAQSIVVTTYEGVYNVMGPHPASVNSQELQLPVGGVSQRGMVKTDLGVAYLSNDGIVIVQGSEATLEYSQRFFTRETWRGRYGPILGTMTLGYQDGCLVCTDTETDIGFIVRFDEAAGTMTEHNVRTNCMLRLPVQDTLYYTSNGKVYRFREGEVGTATWASKEFVFPAFHKFGICYMRATGTGTITATLFADYAQVGDPVQLYLNGTFGEKYARLPTHPGSLVWYFVFEVVGDILLEEFAIAHTMDELKRV